VRMRTFTPGCVFGGVQSPTTFRKYILASLTGSDIRQERNMKMEAFLGNVRRHSQATRKKKVVGLERGPLSLVSTTEELLDRKVAAPV
jgi:hypothetical protein